MDLEKDLSTSTDECCVCPNTRSDTAALQSQEAASLEQPSGQNLQAEAVLSQRRGVKSFSIQLKSLLASICCSFRGAGLLAHP